MAKNQNSLDTSDFDEQGEQEVKNLYEIVGIVEELTWFTKTVLTRLIYRFETQPQNRLAYRDLHSALSLIKLSMRAAVSIPVQDKELKERLEGYVAVISNRIDSTNKELQLYVERRTRI